MFLRIDAYYYMLFVTWGIQLDFVAESDEGTFDVNRIVLAIDLDWNIEEEL